MWNVKGKIKNLEYLKCKMFMCEIKRVKFEMLNMKYKAQNGNVKQKM